VIASEERRTPRRHLVEDGVAYHDDLLFLAGRRIYAVATAEGAADCLSRPFTRPGRLGACGSRRGRWLAAPSRPAHSRAAKRLCRTTTMCLCRSGIRCAHALRRATQQRLVQWARHVPVGTGGRAKLRCLHKRRASPNSRVVGHGENIRATFANRVGNVRPSSAFHYRWARCRG
jgi:hypothetical protein